MNNNSLTEEVTILRTWKGEKIEIDMRYEDFLLMEQDTKAKGEDGFNSLKYRRFIKFSSIEDKIGKTKYIALEAPKEEFKEMTQKERIEFEEMKKKMLEDTFLGRRKNFIERRKEILRDLAKDETRFDLKTTESKLKEYNILKNNSLKNEC